MTLNDIGGGIRRTVITRSWLTVDVLVMLLPPSFNLLLPPRTVSHPSVAHRYIYVYIYTCVCVYTYQCTDTGPVSLTPSDLWLAASTTAI